ncbi:hypothetical protein BDV25DRAFT_135896 [Aspergillus avenaceus]|uniref:Uncharacterized protein n=1 Tax=Aspergillus avenaceus TaxID=36643 RepID=A0A5N6U8M4_ASPAV|nr:hypothetical protein BDV25DRAFT_135896 [Aspergillus avenaceus]
MQVNVDGNWQFVEGIILKEVRVQLEILSGIDSKAATAQIRNAMFSFRGLGSIPHNPEESDLVLQVHLSLLNSTRSIDKVFDLLNGPLKGGIDKAGVDVSFFDVAKEHPFPTKGFELIAIKPVSSSFYLQSCSMSLGYRMPEWSSFYGSGAFSLKRVVLDVRVIRPKEDNDYMFTAKLNGKAIINKLKADGRVEFTKLASGDLRIDMSLYFKSHRGMTTEDIITSFQEWMEMDLTSSMEDWKRQFFFPADLKQVVDGLTSDALSTQANVELHRVKGKVNLVPQGLQEYSFMGSLSVNGIYAKVTITLGKGDALVIAGAVEHYTNHTMGMIADLDVFNPWAIEGAPSDSSLLEFAKQYTVDGEPPTSLIKAVYHKNSEESPIHLTLNVGNFSDTEKRRIDGALLFVNQDYSWAILPNMIVLENVSTYFAMKSDAASGRTIEGYLAGEFNLQDLPNTKLYAAVKAQEPKKGGNSADFWVFFSMMGNTQATRALTILSDPIFGKQDITSSPLWPPEVNSCLRYGNVDQGQTGPALTSNFRARIQGNVSARKFQTLELTLGIAEPFYIFDSLLLTNCTVKLTVENPTIKDKRECSVALSGCVDVPFSFKLLFRGKLPTRAANTESENTVKRCWFQVEAVQVGAATSESSLSPETLFANDIFGPGKNATFPDDTVDYANASTDVPDLFEIAKNNLLQGVGVRCSVLVESDTTSTRRLKLLQFHDSTTQDWEIVPGLITLERARLSFELRNPRSENKYERTTLFNLIGTISIGKDAARIRARAQTRYIRRSSLVLLDFCAALSFVNLVSSIGILPAQDLVEGLKAASSGNPTNCLEAMQLNVSATIKTGTAASAWNVIL